MVFGIVGFSQQESNVWVCDSKTFTQDEKQSWADRVTLMRFVFDFNSDIAAPFGLRKKGRSEYGTWK